MGSNALKPLQNPQNKTKNIFQNNNSHFLIVIINNSSIKGKLKQSKCK